MQRFIVATDDLLFGSQPMEAELVPYQVGMQCWHWELLDEDDQQTGVRGSLSVSAGRDMSMSRISRDRQEADRLPSD